MSHAIRGSSTSPSGRSITSSLLTYFMIVFSLLGVAAYLGVGREEDPNFTIKTMIVSAQWPGASSQEMIDQVSDRIEKKLEELDTLDYTKSVSSPGSTTIFVQLKDTARGPEVARSWLRVRNLVKDIQGTLPRGVIGPFFNDDFGDVFGNVYAFTSDGLSDRQLRDYVEDVRRGVLDDPQRGAGGSHRGAGRGDLPRAVARQARRLRHRPAGGHRRAPGSRTPSRRPACSRRGRIACASR